MFGSSCRGIADLWNTFDVIVLRCVKLGFTHVSSDLMPRSHFLNFVGRLREKATPGYALADADGRIPETLVLIPPTLRGWAVILEVGQRLSSRGRDG